MGRAKRWTPANLSSKLVAVREHLHLTQEQLVEAMAVGDKVSAKDISKFETGEREPPLPVLLRYAQLAGVHMEVLVDDNVKLPKKR
ncbi:MAG TPA: helix-turn-helix transcriptional regulator [Blastocatellia bacterium]